MVKKYKEGLTTVEVILTVLCILFFFAGALLMTFEKPLIEQKNEYKEIIVISEKRSENKKTTYKKEIKDEDLILKNDLKKDED